MALIEDTQHSSTELVAEPNHGLNSLSDQQLLSAFLVADDHLAMETLLKRHWAVALRIAERMTPSGQDADDCVQEAAIVLCRQANRWSGRGTIRAWWLQIVANTCRMQWRSQQARTQRHERAAQRDPLNQPSTPDWDRDETRTLVREAVTELSETYRMPIWLRYVEDLSISEIAHILERNETTVRSQIHRGMKQLSHRLKRHGPLLSLPVLIGLLQKLQAATPNSIPPRGADLPSPLPSSAGATASPLVMSALAIAVAIALVLAQQLPPPGAAQPGLLGMTIPTQAPDHHGWQSLMSNLKLHRSMTTVEQGRGTGDLDAAAVTPALHISDTPVGVLNAITLDARAQETRAESLLIDTTAGRREIRGWLKQQPSTDGSVVLGALLRYRKGPPAPRIVHYHDPQILATLGTGEWVHYRAIFEPSAGESTDIYWYLNGTLAMNATIELTSDRVVAVTVANTRLTVAGLQLRPGVPR